MSAPVLGLAALTAHVGEAWAGRPAREFFLRLASEAPTTTNVAVFMARLPLYQTTIASRFQRHGLPTPKSYLVAFRLYLAAAHLREPRMSVASAAFLLRYSSPQAFGRHLRTVLGITAHEFRRQPPDTCWERLETMLIRPYAKLWPSFDPMANVFTLVGSYTR